MEAEVFNLAPFFVFFFMLLAVAGGLIAFVFWLWMLIDCIQNEPSDGNDKLIWVLVILFTNWIGALIYFFVQRPKRKKETPGTKL